MNSTSWKDYLIEFFTVVFSILLAFALSAYAETRKEKKQYKVFLEGIKQEIEVNLTEVKDKSVYHEQLLEQLETEPAKVNLVIKASNLKSFAWEIAQNDIFKDHVSYNLYSKLGEIYQAQENLREFNNNTSGFMGELNVLGPFYMASMDWEKMDQQEFRINMREGWIPIFQDMTFYEKFLNDRYKEVLECWPCK